VLHDLPAYQRGAQIQDDDMATYAAKILKAEAEIDWRLDAAVLDRNIRAFNPFPVCFSNLADSRIKIWRASPASSGTSREPAGTIVRADRDGILVNCGSGQLLIEQLQLPGAKALTAEQVLNARLELFAPGACFSLPGGGDS
jgi:methionyl-tRNA formyltransferase